MIRIAEEAKQLNRELRKYSLNVYEFLSEDGKKSFFPKLGNISQAKESKNTKINATIGEAYEDDGTPLTLPSVHKNCLEKKDLLYSPSHGQPELRKLWLDHISKDHKNLNSNISLPIVTNGLTQGLYLASQLFVDKDDTLILTDLFWENYKLIFKQAKMTNYKTFADEDVHIIIREAFRSSHQNMSRGTSGCESNPQECPTFLVPAGRPIKRYRNDTPNPMLCTYADKPLAFNVQGLKKALNKDRSKKVVLLNFPNNPTGYSPTKKEAEAIIKVLKETAEKNVPLLVICDDAYLGLNYESDIYPESLFYKLADLHHNILAVKIDGLSKEAYAWGLRIGFITFGGKSLLPQTAAVLEDKTAGLIRSSLSNISNVSQNIAIRALKSEHLAKEQKSNFNKLKKRYLETKKILEKHLEYKQYFLALPFNSGYFMCIRLKDHLADEIRKKLIEKHSVGTIAVDQRCLRIAYSSVAKDKLKTIFKSIYEECLDARTATDSKR